MLHVEVKTCLDKTADRNLCGDPVNDYVMTINLT